MTLNGKDHAGRPAAHEAQSAQNSTQLGPEAHSLQFFGISHHYRQHMRCRFITSRPLSALARTRLLLPGFLPCGRGWSACRHDASHQLEPSRRRAGPPNLVARGEPVVIASNQTDIEEIEVPCRSNGTVKLDVHHHPSDKGGGRTILYLPAGPVTGHDFRGCDQNIIEALKSTSQATIVKVNYRLGNGVRYPTPVHDVLAAYDYVQYELTKASDKIAPVSRRGWKQRSISKIGVCGQLIGGSLATMLALTESKMGESRITAAAVHNPIVDWIFPEPDCESKVSDDGDEMGELIEDDDVSPKPLAASLWKALKSERTKLKKTPAWWELHGDESELPASTLFRIRDEIFRKGASYFDPFASPILFFRSPGVEVPTNFSYLTYEPPTELEMKPTRYRKAHRVFPPSYSTLRIPNFLISISSRSPLRDQGDELTRLMRRSVVRAVQKGRNGFSNVDSGYESSEDEAARFEGANAEAEARIQFVDSPGGIFWGSESDATWREDVERVGKWFKDVL